MGVRRISNEEVAESAHEHSDIAIPFASIDPARGKMGVREARRLISDFGVRGFKFHPIIQGFEPNDRDVYPLYEVIAGAGLPALFHTGQTGIGAGMRGGGGLPLKYANTLLKDRVLFGSDSTHWRTGTWGMTCSTRCAAVCDRRRAPHDGQNPRRLAS